MSNLRKIFTVERCMQHLEQWLLAEEKVSKGQSYTIGNRTLTRANLTEIQNAIELWSKRLQDAESNSSGPISYTVIPR